MPIFDLNRTVAYRGKISVPLIVAFTGLAAIVFSNSSPVPVASGGFWSGTAWDGTIGWVAGSNKANVPGITTFELGVQVGFNTNWIPAAWSNGFLFGPFTQDLGQSGNSESVFCNSKAIPLNSGDVTATFDQTTLLTFPPAASRWPLSNTNGAYYANTDGTGVLITVNNGLNSYYLVDKAGGPAVLISNVSPLVWSAAQSIQSMIGFNGTYYISATGSVAPNNWAIITDLGASATRYTITYASPDGVFDMNTVLKNNQFAFQTCGSGFLFFTNANVTIGGVNYTGYGILILPDFSGYYLIEVLPQSVPAQDWANPARGDPIGKLDGVGNLYIQTANLTGTLYFGGPLQPQLTLYPSLPIIPVPHNPGILK